MRRIYRLDPSSKEEVAPKVIDLGAQVLGGVQLHTSLEGCLSGSRENESGSGGHGDEVMIFHRSGECAAALVNASVDCKEIPIVNDVDHESEL